MRLFKRFAFASSALALILLVPSCGDSTSSGDNAKPLVVSTVYAYFDAARAIGADTIDCKDIIPAGESPHEYRLSGNDKVTLNKANLFIDNGMGLDEPFEAAINDPSKTTILTISKVVPPENFLKTYETPLDAPAATGKDEPAATNPHIWLNPKVQIMAAEKIRDALIKLYPNNKAIYELNAINYIRDINDLDNEFAQTAKTFATTEFIGFHSAYDYLAHRYSLKQVASIEEIPGEGLSPAQAQRVVDLINQDHIQYVAIETALEPRGLDLIKSKTGVHTVVLQPLETYDNTKDTYVSLMKQNLEALKQALGTKPATTPATTKPLTPNP